MVGVAVSVATLLSWAIAQSDHMRSPTSRMQIGTSSFLTSIIIPSDTSINTSDSTQETSDPGSEPVTSEVNAVAEPQSVSESRQTTPTTGISDLVSVDSDAVLSTSTVASLVVTLTENTIPHSHTLTENTILHSHTLTNVSPQSSTKGLSPSIARSQDTTLIHHEITSSRTQVEVYVPTHGEEPPHASISSTSASGTLPSRTMTTTRGLGGGASSESMEDPSMTSNAHVTASVFTSVLIIDSASETREHPSSISETITSDFAELAGTRYSVATSARVADQSQDDGRIVVLDSHSFPPLSFNDETALADIIKTTDEAEKKTKNLSDEATKTGVREKPTVAPNPSASALVASAAPNLPTLEAATEMRAPVQSKMGFSSAKPGDVAQSSGLTQVDVDWTLTAPWDDRTLSTSHHAGSATEHSETTTDREESSRDTATSTHRPAPLPSSDAIPATTSHESTHWLSDSTTWPPSGTRPAFLAAEEPRPTPADVSTPESLSDGTGKNESRFPSIVQEMQSVAQETGARSSEAKVSVTEDPSPVGTVTQLTSPAPDDLTRPSTIGEPLTVTKWLSIITDSEPKASVGPMPDDIPKVLLPARTRSADTKGMALIQIGFLEPLNYNFVASNMAAAAQIFTLLPDALALSHREEGKGEVIDLRPRKTSGYISTMARLSYPGDMLDDLRLNIGTPNSDLHTTKNETLRNLAALIDAGFGPQLDGGDCDSCRGSGSDQGSRLGTMKKVVIATSSVGSCFVICGVAFIVLRGKRRQRHTHYLEKRVPRYEISRPIGSWNSVGL